MKSRGIKEEIKRKSMWNFKVEIKINRNTKGTQEIKMDFQIEIKVESSGFNKSKKNTKWN
jgi:hypothetical protein